MSWWRRLTGGKPPAAPKPQRLDYLNEALTLERQGDYDAALTSYRLALRDRPSDPRILQNMAIAFSKTGRLEDALRCYRRALDLDPALSGAHYGLAFLLLKRGDATGAEEHLTVVPQSRAEQRGGGALGDARACSRSSSSGPARVPHRSRSRISAWDTCSPSSARRAASARRPPR